MPQHILVATDGSALADKAVAEDVALASQCGAELLVLTVEPSYPTALFEAATTFSPEEIGHAETIGAQATRAILDRAAAVATGRALRMKTVVLRSDDIAAAILATASKHQCDLIVMASHGHRGLRRLLLGSQTQNVLAEARMPVLVVR